MERRNKLLERSLSDRMFNGITYLVLILFTLTVLYPLLYVVGASFTDPYTLKTGAFMLIPIRPQLEGYSLIFQDQQIWVGYANSLLYGVVGTAWMLMLTTMAAYPLSRPDFFGKKFFSTLVIIPMFISGGMIPDYLLMSELGLLNSRWVMIIPGALGTWNIMVMRSYFLSNIAGELLDAGRIDGCGDCRFLISVVLPLSGPIIAVLTLFSFIGKWNAYFNAMIYLDNPNLFPLQMVLRNILILNAQEIESMDIQDQEKQEAMQLLLKYSLIVISTLPVMILYPVVQKHFVKGVMVGSLKG